jgi:hypothetical protein
VPSDAFSFCCAATGIALAYLHDTSPLIACVPERVARKLALFPLAHHLPLQQFDVNLRSKVCAISLYVLSWTSPTPPDAAQRFQRLLTDVQATISAAPRRCARQRFQRLLADAPGNDFLAAAAASQRATRVQYRYLCSAVLSVVNHGSRVTSTRAEDDFREDEPTAENLAKKHAAYLPRAELLAVCFY